MGVWLICSSGKHGAPRVAAVHTLWDEGWMAEIAKTVESDSSRKCRHMGRGLGGPLSPGGIATVDVM